MRKKSVAEAVKRGWKEDPGQGLGRCEPKKRGEMENGVSQLDTGYGRKERREEMQ